MPASASDDDDDALQLEDNDDDELVLEGNQNAAGESDEEELVLEGNENDSDSDDDSAGLTLEVNAAEPGLSVGEREERFNGLRALQLKDAGNRAFKEGRTSDASEFYSEGLLVCEDNMERSTLLTNRAACALRLRDWSGAINDCTAALSVAATSPETRTKAFFRRATAFAELGDAESARRDLASLPAADPNVKRLLTRLESDAASTAVDDKTHPDIELIVIDTGKVKSPFFTSKSFADKRVTYLWQEPHQTIGEKRNLAIQHASGDIICHFDDDDLYAPEYVATMVGAMEREGADFVKLSAWLVHDLQTDVTGLFDADSPMPHAQLVPLREQFLFTYGFSFLYRKALFPTFSFVATSWGEDQDILMRVRNAGKKLALHRDLKGICLHNQHGENCSRSFAHVPVTRPLLEASPLGHLLDALPVIGRALTKRVVHADGGQYAMSGLGGGGGGGMGVGEVVVQSDVVGGLFVWAHQLERYGGHVDDTLEAFTSWLWSGNGFSKERYAKLGLERPRPPEKYLKDVAAKQQQQQLLQQKQEAPAGLPAATAHGLESLRALEGMDQPHAPGAIVNPRAYSDPAKKSAAPKPALPKFGFGGGSFGNPTRGFTP